MPGLLALIDGDAAERPLPRARSSRRRERVSALALRAPGGLEAREPPEARGLARDEVRLLVARRGDGEHRARPLPRPARLPARRATCSSSTRRRRSRRRVPARRGDGDGGRAALRHARADLRRRRLVDRRAAQPPTAPRRSARGSAGERVDAARRRDAPSSSRPTRAARGCGSRASDVDEPLHDYLARHGRPIRYGYVPREWPLDAYQTVFAREPGSAEMPSAGRPFTPELVTRLVAARRAVRPARAAHRRLLARARRGAATPSATRSPTPTARLVNAVRGWGGRVIAVGTTVVRALETVAGEDGTRRGRRRLDRPRRHARARPARRRRPAHRLARARGVAPPAARGRRRPRAARAQLRRRARARLPAGTSSATATSSCRECRVRGT